MRPVFFCLIVCILFAGGTVFAQNKEQVMKEISSRAVAAQNNMALKPLELTAKQFLQTTEEGAGGTLTGYFNGDSIVKLNEQLYFDYGGQTIFCTFYKGQPDYAYAQEWHFPIDSLGNINHKSIQVVYEKQYYFNNNVALDSAYTGKPNFDAVTTSPVLSKRMITERDLLMNYKKSGR